MLRKFLILAIALFAANSSQAITYYLKNNNPNTNWNDPCNWYTNPLDIPNSDCLGVPDIGDSVVITGHSFINISGSVTISGLFRGGFGTIGGTGTFTVTNTAVIQGASVDVDGKVYFNILHLNNGTIAGSDTAFVSGAAYFNGAGISGKTLLLNCPGYWNQNNIGVSFGGKLVLAADHTLHIGNNVEGVAMSHASGGYFFNYGTVSKNSSKNLTLGVTIHSTGGTFNLTGGTIAITNNTTLTNATVNVSNNTFLDLQNGSRNFIASTLNSSGKVKSGGSNAIDAASTVSLDTLITGGAFNCNIPLTIPHFEGQGGSCNFYENVEITQSFWWFGGHLYGGSQITVNPLAHLNENGGTDSYTNCKFNFISGAEWPSGNFEMNAGAEFNFPNGADFLITNNGGSISVNSNAPYGEINLTPGSILTKLGAASTTLDVMVNSNQSQILIQQGGLALWRGTHDDSYFQIAPSLVLNCYQNGNFFYRSEITGLGIFRETGFYSVIDSSTTLDCHLEMTGGDLHVRCPITPLSLKITGGELRGTGMISVAGNFNWTGNGLITGSNFINVQGFTTMSGSGGRLMYGEIRMHGGGSWSGTFSIAFSSTGIIRVPAGANLTLSPTTTINNTGTQTANCGIIVEGSLVKTTNFEFDFQGADFTNNGSVSGIGSFRTWNYAFVQPNTGNLSPGTFDTTGTLVWNGLFENKPTGNLVFDFENENGQIRGDSLHFLHNLFLGGSLTVHADPCWPSFEKTILTWAGTKTGSFANLNLPPDYTLVVDEAAKKIKIVHVFLASALTCPANVAANTAPGTCTATPNIGLPTANNSACSAEFTFENDAPASFPAGETIVTWTATDGNGNASTCQQTVTVNDMELPSISCSPLATLNTVSGTCFALATSLILPTANDNCAAQSVLSDAPDTLNLGQILVNFTATDPAGNTAICSQIVEIHDVELPGIVCPDNISIEDCGTPDIEILPATATDNCGIASNVNDAPASFSPGTTIVTHTATDVNGNVSTCHQTVNFSGADVEAPIIAVCPTDKTKTSAIGQCGANVVFSPTASATDNCAMPTLTFTENSGAFFPIGQTIVTLTASDESGNSTTCQFTITINPRTENATNGFDDDCDGTIDEPLKMTFVKTAPTCNGSQNGSIDISVSQGLPPYSFEWSNGETSEDLTEISGGDFSVTATDAQGLTFVKTFHVVEPQAISITFEKTGPSCHNQSNGSMTAIATRGFTPYIYMWSNGEMGESIFGLPAGTFSVVVTDAHGCSASDLDSLENPDPLLISGMTVVNNTCFGASTGKITPVVHAESNGTGALSWLWSNGQTSKTAQNLPAGNFAVVATDANGCTAGSSATIAQPTQLVLSHAITGPDANGKYTVELAASGGTPFPAPDPYRFCKFNSTTGICAFSKIKIYGGLLPGQTYVFRARDLKNCVAEILVEIPVARPLVEQPVDMSTFKKLTNLAAAPNPFSERLTLTLDAIPGSDFQVQILDINGKLISEKTWPNEAQSLDFQTDLWPSGVYFVRAGLAETERRTLRIVKM